MDLGDLETTVKVIVVGNGGVGKSSMTARYCRGVFTSTYKKTIGVDFLEKTIEVSDLETVKLMIWDTAGQEEFDALTASYYRGTGACALVFSTVDRASFEAVEKWKRKVEEQCGPIVMVMVQNKVDLIQESAVTVAEVEALARKLNICLFRTCVKDNLNVSEVFEYLAAQYIHAGGSAAGAPPAVPAVGDLGAVGGHRTGVEGGGGGVDEVAELVAPSAASPVSVRPVAASGNLVREPAGASQGGGGGGGSGAPAAAAAKSASQRIAKAERVVDQGAPQRAAPKAERVVDQEAPAASIKLGADGRRSRPKKGILSFC